jgi:hypothetical protein
MSKLFLGGKEQVRRNKEENRETKVKDRQTEKPRRENSGKRDGNTCIARSGRAIAEGRRGSGDLSRDAAILDVKCFRNASKCRTLRHRISAGLGLARTTRMAVSTMIRPSWQHWFDQSIGTVLPEGTVELVWRSVGDWWSAGIKGGPNLAFRVFA